MKTQNPHSFITIRAAGMLCFWAGVLGAASGLLLAFVQPAVPENQWSYPLNVTAFSAIQVWFSLQHVGLLLGLLALGWTGVLGQSTLARIGHPVAVASMLGFAVTELAAILAANDTKDSPLVGLLGASYGVFSLLLGAALVVEGIAVLRARVWQGWRRWIPLALGVWVFVPMLPALALSFTGARFAIAGWMLLFAALGWALMRHAEGTARKNPEPGPEGRGQRSSLPNPAP
ncbi:hypothetical protein AU252_05520 [Pseudarthrobacter sulfonivorans]|uniref:DUF998 domain-containing protein n=1 Tax=Pseudarthrobacter sulfonivorans TaxID=121292 RepID=A0A0U3QM86_9MICC|nr:hypothetical protein [Pseudarthrobacter sulfonivorans]ALV40693.1 hypothetical protein AU252_05520 [Pseudarthrobacter sulfonivorans]